LNLFVTTEINLEKSGNTFFAGSFCTTQSGRAG
jgi:hypothetical protein